MLYDCRFRAHEHANHWTWTDFPQHLYTEVLQQGDWFLSGGGGDGGGGGGGGGGDSGGGGGGRGGRGLGRNSKSKLQLDVMEAMPEGKGACLNFQNGHCKRNTCKFRHTCAYCGSSDHTAPQCPDNSGP